VPISPISPMMRFLDIVATLSSFMVDVSLSPVCLNSGVFLLMIMSVDFGLFVFEEMNAATTSFSSSKSIRAGLSLVVVRSVNGKGMRLFFLSSAVDLGFDVFDCVDVGFFCEEILK
jgi:hypothetical protein